MCPFLGIVPQIPLRSRALYYPSPGPIDRPGTFTGIRDQGPGIRTPWADRRSLLLLLLCRCRSALGALGSVLGTALLAVGDADRIQSSADNVIADAGKILDAAAADEHNRVLLEVVADAGDVGGDLDPVGQANAGNLTQRRVRLLGGLRVHAGANTTPLRRGLQGRRRRLVTGGGTPLADKLIKSRQAKTPYFRKNRQPLVDLRRLPNTKPPDRLSMRHAGLIAQSRARTEA